MLRHLLRALEVASHVTTWGLLPMLSYRIGRNLHYLWQVREHANLTQPNKPRVSVLIPARNEAANIERCIKSLLQQDYPDFEIVVLDDASTDNTGSVLDRLAAQFPALTILHSQETPPIGWNGKSYACHRLAQSASGSWLLFTDADTVHTPSSISSGIAYAQGLGVSLVSVFPYQVTGSWSERLLVSFIVDFLTVVGYDLGAILKVQEHTVANGQYLLLNAAHYTASGGHAAISSDLLDDFALAQQFKKSGYQAALVDGTDIVSCQMYQDASQVWNGFSKNLLSGLERSSTPSWSFWKNALFPWIYVCTFLFPYLWLFVGRERRWAIAEVGWLSLLRGLVGLQFKRPASEVLTTPIAALGVMALGSHAVYRRFRKQQVIWKGRSYLL